MKSTDWIEFVLNWFGVEKKPILNVPSYLFLSSVKKYYNTTEKNIILRTVFK